MENCDGFFENEGIPYEPRFEDAAVRAVLSADFYDPQYKKWLIICWFDTTFGSQQGSRFDLGESRTMMSLYLKNSPYATYEQMIDALDAGKE
jgi:hypothetical protein